MELSIEIETQDVGLGFYLFEAKDRVESGKTQKTISEDVIIRYEGEQVALAEAFPTIVKITAYIGEHVVLPLAVGFLSRYLYDKLKEKKDSKLRINGTQVEINAEKIEQLIIVILNQEKETKKEGKT
jgi:hypothetical protein